MFVKNNYEAGYLNGSMGIVTGYDSSTFYPVIQMDTGAVITAHPVDWYFAVEQLFVVAG